MRARFGNHTRGVPFLVAITLVLAAAVAVGGPRPTNAQPEPLSLVYLDTEKPNTSEVWVVSLDGAGKRQVALFDKGVRPLDVRGSLLALAKDPDLAIVDLGKGIVQRTEAGRRVQSAYIAENGPVFFTTRVGCGPVEDKTLIGRVDPATGARTDITEWDEPGAQILGYDSASDELLMTPRGCDPGIWALKRLNAKTGAETSSVDVQGCGWAAASPTGKQALVSFAACMSGNFPDLTVYSLPDGAKREVTYAKDAPSQMPFVYAPDGNRAAYGLALGRSNPGGTPKSGGIWLLDTATLEQSKLWQDPGQESWAVAWSPDGAKLVVASVEAQGRCAYSVVDVAAKTATPVAGITGCGVNGTLVGFATVP